MSRRDVFDSVSEVAMVETGETLKSKGDLKCRGWWACPLSGALCLDEHVRGQGGRDDGDLHGWFTAADTNEEPGTRGLGSVSQQPCTTSNQNSFRLRVVHQFFFSFSCSGERWHALIQKTRSDLLTAYANSEESKCRVKLLHAVMQHRQRFTRASFWSVSLFLLKSLPCTNARPWYPWKRNGHSPHTYYISEQLPLEACPVILGELFWRQVMSIGNEEGVAGY